MAKDGVRVAKDWVCCSRIVCLVAKDWVFGGQGLGVWWPRIRFLVAKGVFRGQGLGLMANGRVW
jgi:hypothetical protein